MTDQPTTGDLHARLLAAIDDAEVACATTRAHDALRAVVELHHEEPCENVIHLNHPQAGWCIGCDPDHEDSCGTNPWPCTTVEAIARELGITAEEAHRG